MIAEKWPFLAVSIAIISILLAAITALIGIIYQALNGRMKKLEEKEEKTVGEDACEERRKAIDKLLDRGSAQFTEIRKEQGIQGKLLGQVAGWVGALAKKNGIDL